MSKSVIKFAGVLLAIGLICCVAAFGVDIGGFSIPRVLDEQNGIRRGLDLVGGSVITFEAQVPEEISDKDLKANLVIVQSILTERVTRAGYSEATVVQEGASRFRVEIPAIQDPEEAARMLGSTAQLEFRDHAGNVIMTGADIEYAIAQYGNTGKGYSEHHIVLKVKDKAKFAEITKAAANRVDGENYIAIYLDDEELQRPRVDSQYAATGIDSDSAIISGNYTAEAAKQTANLISSGQLPFTLVERSMRSIGPTLGERALETSLFAGLIGLIMVIILMVVYYRLPGVMSCIALLFYVAIVAIILALTRANLSLPGIAGIILSIGMAVDANVIIFERIKEELRSGKTVRSSVDQGFKRAFTAILDSNLTTLIAAVVLWGFGTGPVVGFAITLFIGVLVSFFTAITVTRLLLNIIVDMGVRNNWLYGVMVEVKS